MQSPPDLGITAYNVAPLLTTTSPGGQVQPQWTVIASCYTDAAMPGGANTPAPRLILGAVPGNLATSEVLAKAQQKRYNTELLECRTPAPDTFTVTLPAHS